MTSLQDQLLKAGLVDTKKAKSADKAKRKQAKVARKSKDTQLNEAQLAVEKAKADKLASDRELNRQRLAEADKKAIAAQIKQLVNLNKVTHSQGDIGYNFVDAGKIKKIYVTNKLQDELSHGQLAIVRIMQGKQAQYELVPSAVATKIAQRDAEAIVLLNEKDQAVDDADDPYAAFQIPDDLMW